MRDRSLLENQRVAILGLGLMGGSLAMALKGRCAALFGADPDPAACDLARRLGVVDAATLDPAEAASQAGLVILAAPVRALIGLVHDLPGLHPGPAVVMDLGSTKAQVVAAMAGLPERFDPIGGHPMCGKEKASLVHAEASLFRGAPFALTPLPRTTPRARRLAEELVQTVGAHPVWLDPDTHDRWTAATSHLPYLASCALAAAAPDEAAPLVGPGFRSATRLAASNPAMMIDILATNSGPILESLARLQAQIEWLSGRLAQQDFDALLAWLARTAQHQKGLAAPQEGDRQ